MLAFLGRIFLFLLNDNRSRHDSFLIPSIRRKWGLQHKKRCSKGRLARVQSPYCVKVFLRLVFVRPVRINAAVSCSDGGKQQPHDSKSLELFIQTDRQIISFLFCCSNELPFVHAEDKPVKWRRRLGAFRRLLQASFRAKSEQRIWGDLRVGKR